MTREDARPADRGNHSPAVMDRVANDRPLLCKLGLHRMSTNRGGIKVCRRDGCRKVRLFGVTGAMREIMWKDELYNEFMENEVKEDQNDG